MSIRQVIVIVAILAAGCGILLMANANGEGEKIRYTNASLANEEKGQISDAIQDMQRIGFAATDDYLVNLRLGWLYYSNRQYEQSEQSYQTAIGLKKNSIEAMLGLTLPLAAQYKWDEVEKTYQEILKINALHYETNLRLGQIYLSRADYEKARNYLTIAYNQYPGLYEVNLSLGWTEYYLGDTVHARECLENALMLSPQDTSALRGMNLLK